MSFDHKAFAFDWNAFQRELLPIIEEALSKKDPSPLIRYIDTNRSVLCDPDEGDTLPQQWQTQLVNRDVDEYGDYALTKFYDPTDSYGLSDSWMSISESLPPEAQQALLGIPVAGGGKLFDPGKMGTYFQDPEQVRKSMVILENIEIEELVDFKELLRHCIRAGLGLYVTF